LADAKDAKVDQHHNNKNSSHAVIPRATSLLAAIRQGQTVMGGSG
jgi:hypothetical protein